jgi:glutamate-1-semialdehyde 2,1-aminomutase
VFGKALGNGYAITAVVGRREVMEVARDTFMSSTFWTERIGPAAALKTLEVMERTRSWEPSPASAPRSSCAGASSLFAMGLDVEISGLDAIPELAFRGPRALAYKTLITQEMLAKGFLASTLLYACMAHDSGTLERYLERSMPVSP